MYILVSSSSTAATHQSHQCVLTLDHLHSHATPAESERIGNASVGLQWVGLVHGLLGGHTYSTDLGSCGCYRPIPTNTGQYRRQLGDFVRNHSNFYMVPRIIMPPDEADVPPSPAPSPYGCSCEEHVHYLKCVIKMVGCNLKEWCRACKQVYGAFITGNETDAKVAKRCTRAGLVMMKYCDADFWEDGTLSWKKPPDCR